VGITVDWKIDRHWPIDQKVYCSLFRHTYVTDVMPNVVDLVVTWWVEWRSVANWHIFMANVWNLAFFGGGWHKYFWFGIFVKFGTFSSNQFFDISKCWTLMKMTKLAIFIKVLAISFGKNLATLPLLVVFTRTLVSEVCNHVALVNTKLMNKLKLSMLNHKCHFASKAQLNGETNLYCYKDLKVTKNAGNFHCCYVPPRQWSRMRYSILLPC